MGSSQVFTCWGRGILLLYSSCQKWPPLPVPTCTPVHLPSGPFPMNQTQVHLSLPWTTIVGSETSLSSSLRALTIDQWGSSCHSPLVCRGGSRSRSLERYSHPSRLHSSSVMLDSSPDTGFLTLLDSTLPALPLNALSWETIVFVCFFIRGPHHIRDTSRTWFWGGQSTGITYT